MTTTKERAAEARARLKAAGYNARKVSVRCEYYSMGSTLHVTIREIGVNVRTVKEVALGAEKIHRCELTGDILGGGNTYVHVHYADKIREEARAEVAEEAEEAFRMIQEDPGRIVEVVPGLRAYVPENDPQGDVRALIDDGTWPYRKVYPQARCLVDLAIEWHIRREGGEG